MSAHVLAYVARLPQLVRADFTRVARGSGVSLRQLLVAGALVAGVTLAIATLPLARPWLHWIGVDHGHHQEIGPPVRPPAALHGWVWMA